MYLTMMVSKKRESTSDSYIMQFLELQFNTVSCTQLSLVFQSKKFIKDRNLCCLLVGTMTNIRYHFGVISLFETSNV
jgi:hypothetical protein